MSGPWINLLILFGFGVAILVLWRTPVLYPFKLITVFIHEGGHALAGLLTGAKLEGFEVTADEGGVTNLRGGNMWLILPAGYLGSSIFGAILILLGTKIILAKIAAVLLAVALLVSLYWASNWLTRGLTLAFIVLLAGFWFLLPKGLPYVIQFLGMMSALYAVYDIFDDTIRRDVPTSDAALLGEKTGLPAIVWGIIWFVFAMALLAGSLYLGFKIQS